MSTLHDSPRPTAPARLRTATRPSLLLLLAILATGCTGPDAPRHPGPGAHPAAPTVGALDLGDDAPPIELVAIPPRPGAAPGFAIGRTEVTNAQYAAFVRATGYDGRDAPSTKPGETFLMHFVDGAPPAARRDEPVCHVNLVHARAFCAWLAERSGRAVRLPTDAEWTWAAAGAAERRYPWGDDWDPRRCNWGDAGAQDGFSSHAPVGSFPDGATPEGALDLAGNAWEWSAEGHLRGGPWCLGPEQQRCAWIAAEDVGRCDDKFGFRVVVELRAE